MPSPRGTTPDHRSDRPPVVAVCGGKHCARKRRDDRRALLDVLGDDVHVVTTRCLDICRGPVAVIEPTSETPVVVERLRKKKRRIAFRRLAVDGKGSGRIDDVMVRGKQAGKTAARAARDVRRRRT